MPDIALRYDSEADRDLWQLLCDNSEASLVILSIVVNSDADRSFGKGRAQFVTGELCRTTNGKAEATSSCRRARFLESQMEPDNSDISPTDRESDGAKQRFESALSDTHSKIESIVLNASVADVYGYCTRFEELPRFITSLREVNKIDETHFAVTSLLASEENKTVLQVVLRVPERRIAWQAISNDFPRGVVLFEPLSDRKTEITVKLRSSIEPATLAKVTREYLTNFKRFIERQ
jgi:Polyketide cyclase / dehydrase and lipid transport